MSMALSCTGERGGSDMDQHGEGENSQRHFEGRGGGSGVGQQGLEGARRGGSNRVSIALRGEGGGAVAWVSSDL